MIVPIYLIVWTDGIGALAVQAFRNKADRDTVYASRGDGCDSAWDMPITEDATENVVFE